MKSPRSRASDLQVDYEAKKDECRVALKGLEHEFWIGTEAGMLGVHNFQGVVLGGDFARNPFVFGHVDDF